MRADADDPAHSDRTRSSAASLIARRPGLAIAIAVLLAAGVLALLQARGPLVEVTTVTRSDIEQRLVASGRVRVVTSVQLTAQAAGRLTQVAVREGAHVRTGDLLAQIDDSEARAAAAAGGAAVAQARGRLQQLREVNAVMAGEHVERRPALRPLGTEQFEDDDPVLRGPVGGARHRVAR